MNALFDLLRDFIGSFVFWHVVQPWERGMRTHFGHFAKELRPGIHFRIPVFTNIAEFDVMPQVVDTAAQTVRTKDGKTLAVETEIRYRIVDVVKAVTRIQDLDESLQNVADGVIGEVINRLNDDDCTVERLSMLGLERLREESRGWGVKVERFYVSTLCEAKAFRIMGDGGVAPVMGE